MKSDFKQKIKSAYYKDFFLRTKNEIEDSDDQPGSVLTKIYTDILFHNGTISDYELLHFEKELSKDLNIKISGYSFSEEDLRLDLFITHYDSSSKIEKIESKQVLKLIESAKNFYLQSTKKLYEKMNAKEDAFDISKDIFKHLKNISTVRIFVLTNCECDTTPKTTKESGIEFQNYLYDINRIYSSSLGGPDSTNIKIDFLKFNQHNNACLHIKLQTKLVVIWHLFQVKFYTIFTGFMDKNY